MNTNIKNADLKAALDEARTVFLDKKLTIDDVSNDIKNLESELNQMGAKDFFSYHLGRAYASFWGNQIDDYGLNAPAVDRFLLWQQHGSTWRIFYCVIYAGWQLGETSDSDIDNEEREKITFADDYETITTREKAELIRKPLIDTRMDIRMSVHPRLAEFVKAFMKDWQEHRYQRSKLPVENASDY